MNMLQVFECDDFGQIRTVNKSGCIWFVASDVCRALCINNSRQALTRIDIDEKGVIENDTLGGKQTMAAVNEQGLYALVLSSRKREAKEFKRWITHDVIPAIRKTGSYSMLPQEQPLAISPKDMKALAKAVAKELQAQEHKALPPAKRCIYINEIDAYKAKFIEEAVHGMEQLNAEDCSVVCSFIGGMLKAIKQKALRLASLL